MPRTLPPPSKTLYLIDVSSFIFRAFFAIRVLHSPRTGEPTNAVYGVAQMLARLVDDANPEYLAVCYDSKEPSGRKEIYPEYKANRSAPPEDLIPQFARVEELIQCMQIHSYRQSGVEADDLIATLTRKWCSVSPEHKVVVVTGDKDLMQLVNERVQIWDTMNDKFYDSAAVEAKFGVRPDQIRDYLAMVGDSSDNIPGLPGVGPKTATDLLRQYQTLDNVLKAADEGKLPGKKGETIRNHVADARLSARLATVDEALPVELEQEFVRYQFRVPEPCAGLLRELGFYSLLQRWESRMTPTAPVAPAPASAAVPHVEDEHSGPTGEQLSFLDMAAGISTAPGSGQLAGGPYVTSQTGTPGRTERPGTFAPPPVEFKTIRTEEQLRALIGEIERTKEFGFDLETTSLNPRQAELVGVAVCAEPSASYYIPVGHRGSSVEQLPAERVLEALRPYLEDPRFKKIGQNLKYDWSVLTQLGLKPDGIGADTMVAAYVLNSEGRFNLQALAEKYLDYSVLTFEQVCGKGKDQIGFDLVPLDLATRYAAEDAWVAVRLWEVLKKRLQEEHLMEVFATIDLPLVDVLARMEREGVSIDVEWLHSLSKEFERDLENIELRVQAYTQGPVNLNSPKQLATLLFEELKLPVQGKTKTGYSTDAQVLEALAPLHEVPRLLLEYREISKLKGTYVDPLPLLRDPKTGKIHAGFHQTVTATGRLSSSEPNLQNIPIRSDRGRKIRRAFVPSQGPSDGLSPGPSAGNVLVAADYSQIELRILAHMSGDAELIRSFQKDEDVHRRTAGEIFGIAPEQVDDRQRGIAKAINFGLMYGKTAFGLAQELKIPRGEAKAVIDRYFARYSGVKTFLDHLIMEARERGSVSTLLGRKRHLPDIRSANPAVRANAERMAMNTPIQGTAADLMKLAMIEIDHALAKRGCRSRLIIQVHDEVVLDCPKDEADAVLKLVTDAMEGALKLDVPLKVNVAKGESWIDL